MTWGWGNNSNWVVPPNHRPLHGGTKGTPDEAKIPGAWPNYEAQYLGTRLMGGLGKYNTAGLPPDSAKEQAYLDKVTDNYKEEADECLKGEFDLWLISMRLQRKGCVSIGLIVRRPSALPRARV